jgi:uncharacterized protein YqeY
MLKDTINSDLKVAMLSGDKERVEALKMLKTAITYKEVELGARDTGLSDEQVIDVLSREAKKRADAAQMYETAGRLDQAKGERFEKEVIATYLPQQATDEEIQAVIDAVVLTMDSPTLQQMGQIIGAVKAKLGQSADGSRISALVKAKLT